jgi:hypothetical protein
MRFFLFLLTVALYALLPKAYAAEIFPAKCGLLVVGPINVGDDAKFHSQLAALFRSNCDGPKVYLYSEGGNLGAALEIGRQIHRLHLNTIAPMLYNRRQEPALRPRNGPRRCQYLPGSEERSRRYNAELSAFTPKLLSAMKNNTALPKGPDAYGDFDPLSGKGDPRCTCASACFFIWAAGDERLGDVILVHRPYFDQSFFAGLEIADAEAAYQKLAADARSYLRELGVQDQLTDRLFSIDSQHASYLTAGELDLLRVQSYISELRIAKCGPEPKPGEAPIGNYYLPTPAWASSLTQQDRADLLASAKWQTCWLKAQAQSRRPAVMAYLQELAPNSPLKQEVAPAVPELEGTTRLGERKRAETQKQQDVPRTKEPQPGTTGSMDAETFAAQLRALGNDADIDEPATTDALKSSPLWRPAPLPLGQR